MKKMVMLCYNDWRNIIRERILVLFMILPMFITLLFRWIVPWVSKLVMPYFDLIPFYGLIGASLLLITPMMMGTVIGFLLLDERDEGVLMSLIVTPLAKDGYIFYRVLFPTVVSFLYCLLVVSFTHFIRVPFIALLAASFTASLEAPLIALYMAVFATNKVEGLALSKMTGIGILAPIAGYFIASPWKYIVGIIPFFWPVQALMVAGESGLEYGLCIIVGWLTHIVLLFVLLHRFERKVIL